MALHRRATLLAALAAIAACLLSGPLAGGASADDSPPGQASGNPDEQQVRSLDTEHSLVTPSEDDLITDEMEIRGGLGTPPAGVTCTYESVQAGLNPAPSAGSFVLLYVLPSDQTAADHYDRPRSCNDGTWMPSQLARASRNLASFQASQGSGLHYRTQNISYQNNFGLGSYVTRGVRRFRSAHSVATWTATKGYDAATRTYPKFTKLRNEVYAAGWRVSGTRYTMLLDAGEMGSCTTTACSVPAVGVAETPGAYGYVVRYWINNRDGSKHPYRYGCSTRGDVIYNHEMTHQVSANHVYDSAKDLMSESGGGGFHFRNGLQWDYMRDSYQANASASVFVIKSSLTGTQYTC